MKIDHVSDLLRIVSEATRIDAATLARAEPAIRAEFGGSIVRIQPKAPITIEAIDQRLRQRMSVSQIADDVDCSRATIYRIIERARGRKKQPQK
jgi:DNA invertase Pin-like site-specific DNA recombinase